MPYVNIRVAGTLTRDQKAKIADEVTDTLHRVANKPKEAVLIFIMPIWPALSPSRQSLISQLSFLKSAIWSADNAVPMRATALDMPALSRAMTSMNPSRT